MTFYLTQINQHIKGLLKKPVILVKNFVLINALCFGKQL